MPRTSSSTTRKRRTTTRRKTTYADTPRLLSEAEKHELIRIHAASRAPQDPLQRTSLWAGVTLCVALLLVGWWMTVGSGIKQTVSGDSDELRALTEELNRFTEEVETNPLLNPPPVVPSPTAEATAAEFDTVLKSNLGLEGSSSATPTHDLLVPAPKNLPPPVPVSPPGLTPETP